MASVSMDDVATGLIGQLKKSSVAPEAKLAQLNTLKSHIKHQRIPETAQANTIECIRLAVSSQTSSSLVTAGLATLAHLIKRLALQDQLAVLFSQRTGMMPVLLDRLGDAKESYRHAAYQAFCDAWSARPVEVEKVMREGAIQGHNARAAEEGMRWVAEMHTEHEMQFRGFVPPIVERLEDADGTIRQAAKNTLVELFRSAPDRAKADLKRQLIAFNVRKSIASDILSQLRIAFEQGALDAASAPSQASRAAAPAREHAHGDMQPTEPVLPPSAETTHIEPLYVESAKELEQIFTEIAPCFEGKETEHNWIARDKNVLRLRRYNQGNAPQDHSAAFVAGLKSLQDGILKVANSLRTTMSTNGCELVQELAKMLGPALEPLVELFLQSFIKMCSATKHISAQNGNACVEAIFTHAAYHVRLSQHVWFACQDKNVQPRSYASSWLTIIMDRHTHNKSHFDHSGGLELTEKSIKKGLSDANPKVREGMRKAYWVFARIWPDKSEAIAATLDAKSRQLLEKDNPKGSTGASLFTSSVGPGSSANPRAASTKSSSASLKETIAAQKRALAARKVPDRPNSAMANLSPAKPDRSHATHGPSALSQTSSTRTTSHAAGKGAGTTSSTGQGSLMSAPVRRPRRFEPTPRPATADPYANQRLLRHDTPTTSPKASPGRPLSKSSMSSLTGGHVKSRSTASNSQPSNATRAESPRPTPSKMRPRTIHGIEQTFSSPRSAPSSSKAHAPSVFTTTSRDGDRPTSSHSSLPSTVEEDNLTLVMPSKTVASVAPSRLGGELQSPLNKAGPDANEPVPAATREQVGVFEDPTTEQVASTADSPSKTVLEELALNERNILPAPADATQHGLGSPLASPIRKTAAQGDVLDRADSMKARRLLASGMERIRARQLDAHGFRRLQELMKTNGQDTDLPYVELLLALLEYINMPDDSLKMPRSKTQNLKSQALGIVRATLVLQRRNESVRALFPRSLCAIVTARRYCDAPTSHLSADLDKTADELLRHVGDQGLACFEAVMSLSQDEPLSTGSSSGDRPIIMCFGVLTKLLGILRGRGAEVGLEQTHQMGKLAVRFLDDADSDVRKADTEFCLEIYRIFGEGNAADFWRLLEGARETQLNLVAYYLARQANKPVATQPA